MKPSLKINKDPEAPQAVEVMERAIVEIAEGTRKMLGGRLNERAILTLLKDATHVDKTVIKRVLDAAATLDKAYLKAAALVIFASALTGCAGAPPRPEPKVISCNTTPQWTVTDKDGKPDTDLYICFRDDGALVWQKAKHPEPVAQAPKPKQPLRGASVKADDAKGTKKK